MSAPRGAGSGRSEPPAVWRHVVRVRYAETDRMGVAYHGAYVPWLEEARTEWFRALGARYRDLEERGRLLAVSRLSIRYRRPARYDDRILVETRLVERGRVAIRLGYRLYLLPDEGFEPGPLIAEAETQLAMTDREGRLVRLPDGFLAGVEPPA